MATPPHIRTGRAGEGIASVYLLKLGYTIKERNVRLGRDEIDIIAFDPVDAVLVFAEVKTRAHLDENFRPEMSADWQKLKKLQRSAQRWIAEHEYDGAYRLDLICVAGGRVVDHFRELSWD